MVPFYHVPALFWKGLNITKFCVNNLITPVITYNNDQIQGVLGGFCRGKPLDIEEITWKLRSLEKEEKWIKMGVSLEISRNAKIVVQGAKNLKVQFEVCLEFKVNNTRFYVAGIYCLFAHMSPLE
jgi:uncharacterized membrane-anchored protein YjiN (DUF445 family)